jgi:Flp pilus assembly protein TadG
MGGIARGAGRSARRGQALVEFALAFPPLVLVALALVQVALYAHAENVVTGAAQDGARVAAESGRSVADGVATTRTLLAAGLGPTASAVAVDGSEDGAAVTIVASGSLPMILPGGGAFALPLHGRASISKEVFVAGPGG